MTGAPLIFLVAGEASGDILGGRLMAGLKALRPGVAFAGVGGERMAEEGLDSLFPMEDLSVMGLAEVLPRLPLLLKRIRQTAGAARRLRPAAVVTIDSPDFSFRVAKRLKGSGIPVIHYVAPSVWAWRPGRARKVAGLVDHLMTLLPFEPRYFEAEGLPATFVGHPVVEGGADRGDGERFRREFGIHDTDKVLCLLPGSRKGEVERLLPVFAEALALLKQRHPNLQVVIPTLPHLGYAIRARALSLPIPASVVEGSCARFDAFAAADVALAASGTVALELAVAGVPTVIAYRVNALTAWLARRLLRVRHVNLVNIVADRAVVPEHLQETCTAERLATSVHVLLEDAKARADQLAGVRDALDRMGFGGRSPGMRAAEVVLDVVDQHSK